MIKAVKGVAVLLLCVFFGWVQASQGMPLSEQHQWVLNQEVQFLEDPQGSLTLNDVVDREDWQQNSASTFNQGYSRSTWWLRLSLKNSDSQPLKRILSIAYPVLGDIQFYQLGSDSEPRFLQMGHDFPYTQRPMDHRHFVVPLEWAAGETVTLYLRVQSQSAVQVPLTLWHPDMFYSNDTTHNILHGIYFGALLVIAIYNLLLFTALGDRNYLYYVGFVACMGLIMAALTGYGFRHLWPAATQWNDQAILVFLAGTLGFAGIFTRRFLRVREISRNLDIAAVSLVLVSVACAVMA
ncbi:MAG: hypothetical protein EA349_11520, partial [Halomonadaceae bacterium]